MEQVVVVGNGIWDESRVRQHVGAEFEVAAIKADANAVHIIGEKRPVMVLAQLDGEKQGVQAVADALCEFAHSKSMAIIALVTNLGIAACEKMVNSGIQVFTPPHQISMIEKVFDLQFEQQLELSEERRRRHILIVDDDLVALRSMRSLLQDYYRISIVASSVDALKLLDKQSVDLILLDYVMPVCNGKVFLNILRDHEKYKAIPVIFLTGVNDTDLVLDCVRHGANGYILKSTSKNDLLGRLNDVFAKDE